MDKILDISCFTEPQVHFFKHTFDQLQQYSSEDAKIMVAKKQWLEVVKLQNNTDLISYGLHELISKQCDRELLRDLPEWKQIQEQRNQVAKRGVIKPLSRLAKNWKDAAYPWSDQSTEFIRYAGKACEAVPRWLEARVKLNQLIICRGKMPRQERSLQTFHMEELAEWVGEVSYQSKRIPHAIPYAPLEDGRHYDEYGLAILPELLYKGQPTFRCQYPANHFSSLPCPSTEQIAPSQILAAFTVNPRTVAEKETQENPQSDLSLRTTRGSLERRNIRHVAATINQPTLRQSRSIRQSNGATVATDPQRLQTRKPQRSSRVRPVPQFSLESIESSESGTRAHYRDQEVTGGPELDELVLADDCVTDLLLDNICMTKKYTPSFQTTAAVQISLLSRKADDKAIADLSSFVIGIRAQHKLDAPALHQLRVQFTLYYNMLSSDCPFAFATTQKYSQQEEWCVVATKTIEKGTEVKYLKGANATIISAIKGAYSSLGRIDGVSGNRYVTAGPVRFVAHSCRPNAELKAKDDYTIVIALRDIEKSEEVTIHYATDFFRPGDQDKSHRNSLSPAQTNAKNPRRFWPLQCGVMEGSLPSRTPTLSDYEGLSRGHSREGQQIQEAECPCLEVPKHLIQVLDQRSINTTEFTAVQEIKQNLYPKHTNIFQMFSNLVTGIKR